LDRALEFVLVDERRRVLAIQRHAQEQAKDAAFMEMFATLGCEAVATFAPAAGPIGIAIAVAWALYGFSQSMHEYREVQTLYDATLDPAILLSGDAKHDPGDPSAVIMDLVGVLTAPF
jgi:hypothetical protein